MIVGLCLAMLGGLVGAETLARPSDSTMEPNARPQPHAQAPGLEREQEVTPTPHPAAEPTRAKALVVPGVVGVPAAEARNALAAAGLVLAELRPARGVPGIVIRSEPAPGVEVTPGTAVTLYVGVGLDRLREYRTRP